MMFGTDYPYASERVSKTFAANLDAADLSAEQFEVINTGAKATLSAPAKRLTVDENSRRSAEQVTRTA